MSDSSLPQHVGLILDGNRRWARERGVPVVQGHRKGSVTLKAILDHSLLERGIPYISAYVFSTENWQRSQQEVRFLMKLLLELLTRDLAELHDKGFRIVWLGSRQEVGDKMRRAIDDAVELTQANTQGTFGICLNHGGHREIAEAVQRLVRKGVTADDVNEAAIAAELDGPDVPAIDLLIRTGGDQRISNFMLWRAAYSELMFTPTLWPDFTTTELDDMLEQYASRQRRFGK